MNIITNIIRNSVKIDFILLSEFEKKYVTLAYEMLQTTLGPDDIEDITSFRKSVSRSTDPDVEPKVICALVHNKLIGVLIGSFLRELNMGFICYGAIEEKWRRNGVYSFMRSLIENLFVEDAGNGKLEFIISEMSKYSVLYAKYVTGSTAFEVPCCYEQPGVQGLKTKPMALVVQPICRCELPGKDELINIINIIYNKIYRVSNVTDNSSFKRIVKSL